MDRRATLLGALALPLLASCRSVDAEQTTTVNAVVETVDPRPASCCCGAAAAPSRAR